MTTTNKNITNKNTAAKTNDTKNTQAKNTNVKNTTVKNNIVEIGRTGANSNYAKGIKAEREVANVLKEDGYGTKLSPGSRGVADITATKSNKKSLIQVKSTEQKDKKPYISSEEKQKLKSTAKKQDAKPIVAFVDSNNKINMINLKTNKKANI